MKVVFKCGIRRLVIEGARDLEHAKRLLNKNNNTEKPLGWVVESTETETVQDTAKSLNKLFGMG
jgi:hypothetical protein